MKSGEGLQPRRVKKPRRIGKHWQSKPPVIVGAGGREFCNPGTAEGCAEYKWRTLVLWLRQEGFCCICCEKLKLKGSTFEHEDGRTKARKDERLWDAEGGPKNGVSHLWCNKLRGSKRTPIYHYPQFVLQEGESMDREQAEELAMYLKLTQCACMRKKASGEPFCENCRGRLSPQQVFDLDPMKATYLRGVARVRQQVMNPEAA